MPDFRGYTPDNYLKDFDEDRILVSYIAPAPMSSMEPGSPGYFAPNSLARLKGSVFIPNPDSYEEKFELQCFEQLPDRKNHQTCFGERRSTVKEHLILNIMPPPHESWVKFPTMDTTYFSPKYGGIDVSWRAHMKHLPHWREIDEQVWKYIDAWNVAPQSPKN